MGGHSDSGITSACALSDMTSVFFGNAFQQFLASLARPFLLAFSAHASAVPIWSCNFVLVCEHIFCSLSCVAGFCSAPPRPVKRASLTNNQAANQAAKMRYNIPIRSDMLQNVALPNYHLQYKNLISSQEVFKTPSLPLSSPRI